MLKEHNIPVYEQFEEMLLREKECILITATGTGKSYVTMEFIKKHNLKTLVVCPKLVICKNWSSLATKYSINELITSISYSKFYNSYKKFALDLNKYDCIVFDEAHHIGSEKWGKVIATVKNEYEGYTIGLTAESVRYLDGCKDVAFEYFNGNIVYGYNYNEAVSIGILPKATYVKSIYSASSIKDSINSKISESLNGKLDIALKNIKPIHEVLTKHAYGNDRKGIIFVDRINSLQDGINVAQKSFPKADIFVLTYKDSDKQQSEIIRKFKASDHAFIIAIDMLNEGLHISGINTLIMLRKTISPNLYLQQIGRVFSLDSNNIIIFDFVNNCNSLITSSGIISRSDNTPMQLFASDRKMSDQLIVLDYTKELCDILTNIEVVGVKRRWTNEEDEILRKYYPTMGSKVSEMLPDRSVHACVMRSIKIGVHARHNLWTNEEDEILRKYYPTIGIKVSEMLHNRCKDECRRRASYLGLTTKHSINWTNEEDEILRKYYPTMGSKVSEMLPGRSVHAIRTRAGSLKIFACVQWSDEEINIIKKYYSSMGCNVVEMLPNKTTNSIKLKARTLGLRYACMYEEWTEEEDEILRKFYPTMGKKVEEMLPKRDGLSCYRRARKLNIKFQNVSIPYSEEELYILKTYYTLEGLDIIKRLPNRSITSIRHQVYKLGLGRDRRWTNEEDEILRKYYPTMGSKVSEMLPGRSLDTCKSRAHSLGIKYIKNEG